MLFSGESRGDITFFITSMKFPLFRGVKDDKYTLDFG
jgi:hypothetical protein